MVLKLSIHSLASPPLAAVWPASGTMARSFWNWIFAARLFLAQQQSDWPSETLTMWFWNWVYAAWLRIAQQQSDLPFGTLIMWFWNSVFAAPLCLAPQQSDLASENLNVMKLRRGTGWDNQCPKDRQTWMFSNYLDISVSKDHLNRQFESVHEGKKQFKCNDCTVNFH